MEFLPISPLAILRALLLSTVLVLLGGCGDGSSGGGQQFGDPGGGGGGVGGGGGGGGLPSSNPNFAFTFEGVTHDGRKVTLFLAKEGDLNSSKGDFDAQSTMSVSQRNNFSPLTTTLVTGTFDGDTFVLRTAGGSSYSGRFTDADTIELTNDATSGRQIYTRNKNDEFAPRLTGTWSFPDEPTHLLQLQPTAPFTDDDITLIVQGVRFGSTARTVTGYASVSRVQLTVHEQDGSTTRLQGRFSRAGDTWNPYLIELDDGRQMVRGGGTPDAQRVLYLSSDGAPWDTQRLVSVDLRGVERTVISGDLDVRRFSLSRDGQRVAVVARRTSDEAYELVVIELATRAQTPITSTTPVGGEVFDAAWSPDGQRIGYIAYLSASAPLGVYVANSNGTQLTNVASAPMRPPIAPNVGVYRIAWSASGSYLAFAAALEGAGTTTGLYAARADGSQARTLFEAANGGVYSFEWAPAGDTVTYLSNNGWELWRTNVAVAYANAQFGPGYIASQVTTYTWSHNGSALAYVSAVGATSQVTSYDVAASTYKAISSSVQAPNGVSQFVYWRPDDQSLAYLPINGLGWIVSDGTTSQVVYDPESTRDCGWYLPKLGWSPDGTAVAYWATSPDGCRLTVYEFASTRRTQISQVIGSWNSGAGVRWIDGTRILFAGDATGQYRDSLHVAYDGGAVALDLLGGSEPSRLVQQQTGDYVLYVP